MYASVSYFPSLSIFCILNAFYKNEDVICWQIVLKHMFYESLECVGNVRNHICLFLFLICEYHIEQQGAPRKLLKFSLSYKYLDATFYIHTFQATFSTFLIQTLFPMNFRVNYFNVLQFHPNITIWLESNQRMCVILTSHFITYLLQCFITF